MDSNQAAEILRGKKGASMRDIFESERMGAEALEAWAWAEQMQATVQPLGAGWNAETIDDDGRCIIGTGTTPLAAVLDAMEKEGKG